MGDEICVVAKLTAKPGREQELREALRSLVSAVRTEPGCEAYDLHEASDSPSAFMFYEVWTNADALDAHNSTQTMQDHVAKTASWVENLEVTTYRRL